MLMVSPSIITWLIRCWLTTLHRILICTTLTYRWHSMINIMDGSPSTWLNYLLSLLNSALSYLGIGSTIGIHSMNLKSLLMVNICMAGIIHRWLMALKQYRSPITWIWHPLKRLLGFMNFACDRNNRLGLFWIWRQRMPRQMIQLI